MRAIAAHLNGTEQLEGAGERLTDGPEDVVEETASGMAALAHTTVVTVAGLMAAELKEQLLGHMARGNGDFRGDMASPA